MGKMKKIILFAIAISLISCDTYKRESFTYNENEKQLWINSYKYEAFYGCMNQGLENDSLKIILKSKDLFNPNLNLDFSTIDLARQSGKNSILQLPKPFIKVDVGEENLQTKNYFSYTCLKYYASRELDSTAQEEYKKYKKN